MMKLLKYIDAFAGSFTVSCARLLLPDRHDEMQKHDAFLFIRPGGIGDAVLLIPAIIALKKRFPHAVIDVLSEKRNYAIFSLCPYVNRILCYDNPTELLTAIRSRHDVVIDTEQWHRLSAVVARLMRAQMSVGYATNERKRLFTHAVPYSHDDYEAHSFFNLIAPITGQLPVDFDKPFLTVSPESTNRIRSLLQPLANKKIVVLFPGGSIRERRWGRDRFHQTAQALIERGYGVVVIGGKGDLRAGEVIAGDFHHIVDLCGKLSLVEAAAVLQEASLLITGDSGIMHIGYGLGIKTLSLFGPGIEKKWAPRGNHHIVINKSLDCSPCTKFGYTPKCTKNAECMKRITVDEVVQKALDLLEG
jgi:lipopolysaccharide heptosyltransferase II